MWGFTKENLQLAASSTLGNNHSAGQGQKTVFIFSLSLQSKGRGPGSVGAGWVADTSPPL